ncbi:MAG: NigD-like C-terminal domain-containing protein [Candidatus Hodarchaeota archaeon]
MSLSTKLFLGILLTLSIPSIIVLGFYTLTQLNEGDLSNDYIGIQQILLDNSSYKNSPRDTVTFNNITLDKDLLTLEVSYGGGCRKHIFTLIGSNVFKESNPVRTDIVLSHNANDDPCEAWLTEKLHFDLSPLKKAYKDTYSVPSGSILIYLEGVENGILYEF